jgi:hypothetical protein
MNEQEANQGHKLEQANPIGSSTEKTILLFPTIAPCFFPLIA